MNTRALQQKTLEKIWFCGHPTQAYAPLHITSPPRDTQYCATTPEPVLSAVFTVVSSSHNVHMYTLKKISTLLLLVLITFYCVGTSTVFCTRAFLYDLTVFSWFPISFVIKVGWKSSAVMFPYRNAPPPFQCGKVFLPHCSPSPFPGQGPQLGRRFSYRRVVKTIDCVKEMLVRPMSTSTNSRSSQSVSCMGRLR